MKYIENMKYIARINQTIFSSDPVQFGEVVSQPPSISALPRKGGGKKV